MAEPRRPGVLRRGLNKITPKSITDWNHKRIGAVTLFVVAAIVLGALGLTSSAFASTFVVHARFANAVGLTPGDSVVLAGVNVGKVQNVRVVGNHVEANLTITDGVQLPSDSSAQIAVQSLLGVIGVTVTPGGNWGHLLTNGSTITNTTVPFEYFEVQNTSGKLLSATDAHALGGVVTALAKVTSGDKTQIQQVIDGLGKATTTINAHRNQAGQLITAAESLSAALAAKDHELATVVDDLNLVVHGLANRSTQLGQLIDQTEQVASQTSSLIGRNQPKIQQLLTALHGSLQVIGAHQIDLARSAAFAASAIKGFASVGKSGVANTPWANIYANILGASIGDAVLGPCGAMDSALDAALGPDPKACNQRTGPLPGTTPSTSASAASLVLPLTGRQP